MSEKREDDDWQRETRDDLRSAEATLEHLSSSLAGEPDEKQLRSAWEAYLRIEKSVAFIRVELDEENPDRFIKPKAYVVPDERQAIGFALRSLRDAIARFEAGELSRTLKPLRESRNYLRVLLRQKRLLRAKRARASAARPR